MTRFMLIQFIIGGGLIPNYLLIKYLGMYNTIWALVIPGMISTFNILIMRNFFRSLPDSLEESAMVDGAGYLKIFFRIIIPLSMPIIATEALWVGVGHWNAWFDAMLYIQDQSKTVLQILLRRIVIAPEGNNLMNGPIEEQEPETLKAAIIMFTALPILVVYPFLQKYFVKGVLVGSLKE